VFLAGDVPRWPATRAAVQYCFLQVQSKSVNCRCRQRGNLGVLLQVLSELPPKSVSCRCLSSCCPRVFYSCCPSGCTRVLHTRAAKAVVQECFLQVLSELRSQSVLYRCCSSCGPKVFLQVLSELRFQSIPYRCCPRVFPTGAVRVAVPECTLQVLLKHISTVLSELRSQSVPYRRCPSWGPRVYPTGAVRGGVPECTLQVLSEMASFRAAVSMGTGRQ